MKAAAQVIRDNAGRMLALPGVVGLTEGVCEGRPCLWLLLEPATQELDARVPLALEGYPIVVQ